MVKFSTSNGKNFTFLTKVLVYDERVKISKVCLQILSLKYFFSLTNSTFYLSQLILLSSVYVEASSFAFTLEFVIQTLPIHLEVPRLEYLIKLN